MFGHLRKHSAPPNAGDPGSPIPGYDGLNTKQLIPQLSHLSQLALAAVEAHERSHQARPAVLNRLRWLSDSEPMPGYDALATDEIVRRLAGAESTTIKAVRSYERHHRDRREISAEAARVLPTARVSVQQNRAKEDKAALVRVGMRDKPLGRAR